MDSFDEIRPFYDHEVAPALKRIVSEGTFDKALNYLFPGKPTSEIHYLLNQIQSIADFQKHFSNKAVESIIHKSVNKLTFDGLENIPKDEGCLIISNHRDIVLDPAFLNYILFNNDRATCQVAIGNNLLLTQDIEDLAKINKCFIVIRNRPARESLINAATLSNYVHHTVAEKKEAVWIAQREGRTKDGNDKTQQGLLKMLATGGDKKTLDEKFKSLNIIPLAISYEYESCAGLKAREMIRKNSQEGYKKSPQDDLQSMITGISSNKGNVHFSFGKPVAIDKGLGSEEIPKNDRINNLAVRIDKRIYDSYKLWGNNYIAFDLLHGTKDYAAHYSEKVYNDFEQHLGQEITQAGLTDMKDEARKMLLAIYANPVLNKKIAVKAGAD